jgi:hypothetical protein
VSRPCLYNDDVRLLFQSYNLTVCSPGDEIANHDHDPATAALRRRGGSGEERGEKRGEQELRHHPPILSRPTAKGRKRGPERGPEKRRDAALFV